MTAPTSTAPASATPQSTSAAAPATQAPQQRKRGTIPPPPVPIPGQRGQTAKTGLRKPSPHRKPITSWSWKLPLIVGVLVVAVALGGLPGLILVILIILALLFAWVRAWLASKRKGGAAATRGRTWGPNGAGRVGLRQPHRQGTSSRQGLRGLLGSQRGSRSGQGRALGAGRGRSSRPMSTTSGRSGRTSAPAGRRRASSSASPGTRRRSSATPGGSGRKRSSTGSGPSRTRRATSGTSSRRRGGSSGPRRGGGGLGLGRGRSGGPRGPRPSGGARRRGAGGATRTGRGGRGLTGGRGGARPFTGGSRRRSGSSTRSGRGLGGALGGRRRSGGGWGTRRPGGATSSGRRGWGRGSGTGRGTGGGLWNRLRGRGSHGSARGGSGRTTAGRTGTAGRARALGGRLLRRGGRAAWRGTRWAGRQSRAGASRVARTGPGRAAQRRFARTSLGRRLNRGRIRARRSRHGRWMGLARPMPRRLTASGFRVRGRVRIGNGSHRRNYGTQTRPPAWAGRWARRRRVARVLFMRSAAGRRFRGARRRAGALWRGLRAFVATQTVATTRGNNLPNVAGRQQQPQARTGQARRSSRLPIGGAGAVPVGRRGVARPLTGATGTRRAAGPRVGIRRPLRVRAAGASQRVAGQQSHDKHGSNGGQNGSEEGHQTMRGFRHAAPESAGNNGTGGAQTTPQPAWVTEVLDNLAAASRGFSPENARAMVEVVEHYPAILHGMSQFARDIATRSVEAIEMPPAAAETLLSLSGIQERMAEAVETAMGAVKKVLDWHIARASSGSAKVEAWDVRRWENAGR